MNGPVYVEVVVVSCSCGMFPLDNAMHPDAATAWTAASAHYELNPRLCRPNMHRELAPAALAPAAR
jgi:hypothetical protein